MATIGTIARMERLIDAIRERITRPLLGSIDLDLNRDLALLFAEYDGDASTLEQKAREDHARNLEIVNRRHREADELREFFDRRLAETLSGVADLQSPAR